MTNTNIDRTWLALRLTYGAVPLIAGLDKFFNLLTNWEHYIAPIAANLLPVSAPVFMRVAGIIEMIAGLLILTRWTRAGAYIVSAWLVCIAVNLLLLGAFDIAVRDVVMAVGAWTLGQLTEVREPADASVHAGANRGRVSAEA